MAVAFNIFDTTAALVVEQVKQKILASSDWAHLQLSTGTQNTTLTAGASAGATQVQVNTTIPSGSYIVIGNGAANPEVRLTTGVSGGAGAFIVTFATPLVATYANAAAVGVGTYVKATTTRGAQMVIDLLDGTLTSNKIQVGVYRTHDGTTAVDKVVRYVTFNSVTPATTTVVHVVVSAGKEHVYFSLEGPRVGETGVENASWGGTRQAFSLCDLVPYHAGDTVPVVVLAAHSTQSNADVTPWLNVSRNQGDTSSWVRGYALTLGCAPNRLSFAPNVMFTPQPVAKGDGKYYVWPFVVVEVEDGLRGRLAKLFYAGANVDNNNVDDVHGIHGQKITYSSAGYTTLVSIRGGLNYEPHNGIASCYRSNAFSSQGAGIGNGTLLAIPNGL